MKYNVNSVSCTITEDSYQDGMSIKAFHSYGFHTNQTTSDKEGFLSIISGRIGKDVTEEDLNIEENRVYVLTMNAYKPNQDWDEFPIATDEEIEKWKLGEMKLYVAEYTFICYNLNDEFKFI
jgi:hypothetical protein